MQFESVLGNILEMLQISVGDVVTCDGRFENFESEVSSSGTGMSHHMSCRRTMRTSHSLPLDEVG